jgi:hypothetical protein
MPWPFRRRRRREQDSTGVNMIGSEGGYVAGNRIEGYDQGVRVEGGRGVTVVRNIVRRGPRSRRDWTVLATLVIVTLGVVAVLAWLWPM